MTMRPMTRADVPDALRLWNADFVHDAVAEDRLEKVIFDDPHFPEGIALVLEEGGELAGFLYAVAPDPSATWVGNVCFLKLMCGPPDEEGSPAERLLEVAEGFCVDQGCEGVHVVEYAAGGHIIPGIDRRYGKKMAFFEERGYSESREIRDVALDLTDFEPGPWAREARQQAADRGIGILPYDTSMIGMLREFVADIGMGHWFRQGWQKRYFSGCHTFVAVQDGRILGYADYAPGEEYGHLGTTAVRRELRGQGIGSCLLTACMVRLKELGTPLVVAEWANTPFYLKNGWQIWRRYAVLHKALP
jgi:GNAT superfamily N-acetyltransferase